MYPPYLRLCAFIFPRQGQEERRRQEADDAADTKSAWPKYESLKNRIRQMEEENKRGVLAGLRVRPGPEPFFGDNFSRRLSFTSLQGGNSPASP